MNKTFITLIMAMRRGVYIASIMGMDRTVYVATIMVRGIGALRQYYSRSV
jgi:hypothetical protein